MDVTLTWAVILSAAGIILAIGLSYGDLRARVSGLCANIKRIETMLGNGAPGVFVRKEVVEQLLEESRRERKELHGRIETLERRE